jgi:hypothetical protein
MRRPADLSPNGLKRETYLTDTSDQKPAKPQLALRVGVTGTRRLSAGQVDRIQKQLDEVLKQVKENMEALADATLETGDYYEHDPGKAPEVTLRMISPLARGADRMAAQAALDAGYQLYVPMPFAQAEYEKDFTGSDGKLPDEVVQSSADDLAEFRRLLPAPDSARVEMDGGRYANPELADGSLAPASYEAVGEFVARHCDLLLAVWDGKPSNGRGGTAEIVEYAVANGIPVWWIHAGKETAPVWIADVLDLPPRAPLASRKSPDEKLKSYLKGLILAPPEPHEQKHGWIESLGAKLSGREHSSLDAYFDLPPQHKWLIFRILLSLFKKWMLEPCTKLFLKAYPFVMSLAEHTLFKKKPGGSQLNDPTDPVPRYWNSLYTPADSRANGYAARYRSGYVLTILLTAQAPILGAAAIALVVAAQGKESFAGLAVACAEFVDLSAIVGLVAFSLGAKWHQRSIEYRLLAELYRKQQILAPLGWTLPIDNVQQVGDARQQSWVVWLFAASLRAAPMVQGTFASAERANSCKAAVIDLINDQMKYHIRRQRRSRASSRTFENLGSRVFEAVLVCVIVKIVLESWEILAELPFFKSFHALVEMIPQPNFQWPVWLDQMAVHTSCNSCSPQSNFWWLVLLGLLATVLPTISAAFVAIRSYAELQMLVEQSRYMRSKLWRAKWRVKRIKLDRPLASQDLGAEALGVAAVMLRDLEGWGRLFRGKILEAS